MSLTEELFARLDAAFPPTSPPEVLSTSFGPEVDALRADFRGKRDWRALSADFLERAGQGEALAFLSDEAFCFFLPAWVRADLRGELRRTSPVSRLTAFVTPQSEGQRLAAVWGGGTMGERARQCFARFDRAQVELIVAYLEWKLAAEPDDLTLAQALEHSWRPRCALVKPGAS